MKCFALVVVTVALAIGSTRAAECTQAQLVASNAQDGLNKLQTVCASSYSLASSSTAMADPQGAAKKICNDKPCMAALEAAMENLPDCTIMGEDFKTKYVSQISFVQSSCKKLGVSVEKSTTAPVSASSNASTSAVGVTAMVAAVGAVLAQ